MKKFYIPSLLAFFLLFSLGQVFAKYVHVISPNGGENWKVGTVETIKWEGDAYSDCMVDYTTDNGTSWHLIAIYHRSEAWTHEWTIPDTPSERCRVRVRYPG